MEFLLCEKCVFGKWDDGDSSVGIQPYVEECKNKAKSVIVHFDIITDKEDYEHMCPFYIEQMIPENELILCPNCKSRDIGMMGTDLDNMIGMFSCDDCDYIFNHELII